MKLKFALMIAGASLALTAGPSFADVTTVVCENKYVITFSEEDGIMLKDELGAGFEAEVCEVSKDLNWATYETPTEVKVTMASGREFNITAQQINN